MSLAPSETLGSSRRAHRLTKHMFVLGIDPGLARTGYAVVEETPQGTRAVCAGALLTDPEAPIAERLSELFDDLTRLVAEYQPQEAAIEDLFVNKNLHTATAVGRASGVALLALARSGIPVHEYTPSAVKAAVCGYGDANKEQVQRAVMLRLALEAPPTPADAADALAVALCHAQSSPMRRAVEGAR